MAFGDRTYTRVVRSLKVALPLIALVLLSTMFMLSRKVDPTAAMALSDQAFRDRIDRSELSTPQYVGNTNSGKNLTVTAKSARPDPHVSLDNGEVMNINADTGVMDEAEDLAVLSGNVHIVTTDGYDFRTSQLTSLLSTIEGESAGQVDGFGPPGTLTAGKMTVKTDPQSGKVLLIFTKGVHLLYNKPDQG
jgi:lipopolysaccharide export system protein LptC